MPDGAHPSDNASPGDPGKWLARRCERLLDLLTAEMSGSPGLVRSESGLISTDPWSVADYGQYVLGRGWWVFECEGDDRAAGVELRLRSVEDPLLVFSRCRDAGDKIYFQLDRTFDVSVLIAAWPGEVRLRVLRLRRLSLGEQMQLGAAMLGRLLQSRKPFSKAWQVGRRIFSGHSIHVRSKQAPPVRGLAASVEAPVPARVLDADGVTVVLGEGERLHPAAIEIVQAAFARTPALKAIYSDVDDTGGINPRPGWDDELAAFAAFASSPIFFRGGQPSGDAWDRLRQLAAEPGAVSRISLPLASRSSAAKRDWPVPAVPVLPRAPLVSVIIPTKIRIDLLERCLASLSDRTGYEALEVVIVNNGATDPRFPDVIAAASSRIRVRQVDDFGPFNFSRLINAGVRKSTGDIVLMLNDDVEAIEPGWLHRMVASAQDAGAGCVGARLLYADRTIQHAGVTLGLSGICGHLWRGLGAEEAAAIPQIVLPGRRMAVTGACLAVRRDLFDRVGGLDEERFPVAYNDIDFCLRVGALGYRTIYRGDAALIHHESQSRGSDNETDEKRKRALREATAFLDRWGPILRDDPFGSPAFDPSVESGAIHPSLDRG